MNIKDVFGKIFEPYKRCMIYIFRPNTLCEWTFKPIPEKCNGCPNLLRKGKIVYEEKTKSIS